MVTMDILTLCDSPFRPINISQRVSPVACTAMTSSATAQRTPHHPTRCSGGQRKVPSADTLMGADTAKRNLLKPSEGKMVRQSLWLLNTFTDCHINKSLAEDFWSVTKPAKCIIPKINWVVLSKKLYLMLQGKGLNNLLISLPRSQSDNNSVWCLL